MEISLSCAVSLPRSHCAAEVPVLLYGDLGQGFGRTNTFLSQSQCQVWLTQNPHVAGKVPMSGGQFYRLHLIPSTLNHQVISMSAL